MSSTASQTGVLRRFWAMNWPLKLLVLAIAPITLFLVGLLLLDMFNYSVGERWGVVSKLSTKGVACWTMEGELAQPNFSKTSALRSKNAAIDNTFYFSVPDPDVRKQLEAVPPGSAVTLQYNQKLFALDLPIPLMCRRRTQFEIVGVRLALANQPEAFPAKPALAGEFDASAPKSDAEASKAPAEPASESATANAAPYASSVAPTSETPAVSPKDEKAEAAARWRQCRAEWKAEPAHLKKKHSKLTWNTYWKQCDARLAGAKK
jgi:hypothetical protein